MHIISITLKNIFSYYGEKIFDLSPPNNGKKNIVIIRGRNNQGKTSFLNSIKLLFGGVSEDLLQKVPRGITTKQYIYGASDRWWGILNYRAKEKGVSNCSISIKLYTENGEALITRKWSNITNTSFNEMVMVDDPIEGYLENDQAQEYLNRILPIEYLPFFFFDGEEVQHLAEANTNQTISKMEQLLNIRPVENVLSAIKSVKGSWKSQSMDRHAVADLEKAKNKKQEFISEIAGLEQEKDDLENDLAEEEEALKRTERMLDIIGGHTGVENRAILKTEVKHLEETQDELFAKISDFFGGDAFLMLNPKLIEKSLKIIQKNIHNFNQQQLTLLGTLQNQLPILLEQPPYSSPPLTTNQIAFYQQRIKKQIEVFQQPINSEETFNLDPSRAQKLYDTLIRYSDDPDAFSELRKLVSKARNIQIAINQKNDLLDNAKHLAEEEKKHFQELKEQESIIKKTLFEINDSIRDKDSQITQIASSLSEITQNINRLVDSVKVAEDYRGRYDLATRTQNMLESFKHDLKKEAREQLEIEVNKNLSTILDSNTLINTVKISDEFLITYLDQRGNSIGMGTISAGMKQIAATSLLWALKTVSNKEFPVIIDTPLARIDAQHQANLLERYYPHASKQVIILPTDSELDESKSKKLQKHCYKTFELKNPSGTNTEIVTLEVPNG